MQNRYVGDIGDFGKYALLRALCDGSPSLKLGVVWYLYTPKNENLKDGDKTEYPNLAECDEKLYKKLQGIVDSTGRNIFSIRRERVLPSTTVFDEDELNFASRPGREVREAHRKNWLDGAIRKTRNCDIVFLDPDNGLEVQSVRSYYKKGPKYVFLTEITPYLERNQSVVIYQHVSRQGTAEEQVCSKVKQLREELCVHNTMALYYGRGTARVFFVLASHEEHRKILRAQTDRLLEGLWAKHFQLING